MSELLDFEKALLSPPGDTIQETIEAIGMSQIELAERMGRPKEKVNDMIKGREPITTATAFQLERVLGIPASFWMNREKEFRRQLFEIEQKEVFEKCLDWVQNFPITQMKKFGWIKNYSGKSELVNQLLNFFGVASPKEWSNIYIKEEISVAFRTSLAHTQNPFAISAWLRAGEIGANSISVKEYDKGKFKSALVEIKELAFKTPPSFPRELQEICADAGVAVVYTPNIPKAPISGATRWFHNRPLVQLSGRYKTDDQFWFTFFHEAGHIFLHGKKDIFLEDVEGSKIDEKKEEEANKFASDFLLNNKEFQEIIESGPLSQTKLIEFSNRFRTPVGVIIGRLQHERRIAHSVGNHLRKKVNLFE